MRDIPEDLLLRRCRHASMVMAIVVTGFMWNVSPAMGQSSAPNSTEPGKIEKRVAPPSPLRRPVERIVPAAPELPPRAEPLRKFVLTGVEIVGATVYEPEEFSDLYEDMLGRETTETDVAELVEAVTQKYRDDGYVLSRAIAEPQSLEFGVLRIRAVEGYVDRLVLEGDTSNGASLLTAYGRKISDDRPLRQSILERYVLLMSDIPGAGIKPSLREPVTDSGAYELVLTVTRNPVSAFANLDNRGTNPIGPLQLLLGTDVNGVLGLDERTRLLVFTIPDEPDELRFFDLSHEQPIGSEGTRAMLSASRSKVDFYSESSGAPQRGDNRRYGGEVSHPLIRSRELSVYLNGGYEYVRSAQEALDDDFVDRMHVVRLGSDLTFEDSLGGPSTVAIEVRKGLDIFNASERGDDNLSRTDGRSDFTKITADLSRTQHLFGNFTLQLDVTGQLAADVLLSNEEFSIGGSQFGRAYDSSELSGVHGVAGVVELQYGIKTPLPFFKSFTLYGFYDAGTVWDDDGESTPLTSAGGGVRLNPIDGLIGSLEVAKPLNRNVAEEGNQDARVFFSLTAQF